MRIAKITKYGIYDSSQAHKNKKMSPVRTAEAFEFDFIISCTRDAVSYIDDNAYKLIPNILIIRKPGQRCNSRLHFKCNCLHIRVEKDSPFFEELCALPNYLTFINPDKYLDLFEKLFEHLVINGQGVDDYFVSAKLLELFYYVKKDAAKTSRINQKRATSNRYIQKTIVYIKSNLQSKINLMDLSKVSGYSPNYFQQLFVKTIGISPSAYVERVRVNYAKNLLIQPEKSLTYIAYECGFSSQSYFCKVFKKHTGLSPSEFQKQHQIVF